MHRFGTNRRWANTCDSRQVARLRDLLGVAAMSIGLLLPAAARANPFDPASDSTASSEDSWLVADQGCGGDKGAAPPKPEKSENTSEGGIGGIRQEEKEGGASSAPRASCGSSGGGAPRSACGGKITGTRDDPAAGGLEYDDAGGGGTRTRTPQDHSDAIRHLGGLAQSDPGKEPEPQRTAQAGMDPCDPIRSALRAARSARDGRAADLRSKQVDPNFRDTEAIDRLKREISELDVAIERLLESLERCVPGGRAPAPPVPAAPGDDGEQQPGGEGETGGSEGDGDEEEGDDPRDADDSDDPADAAVPNCCQLLLDIVSSLRNTQWGKSQRGKGILDKLTNEYLDNGCSDITFVVTEDQLNARGKAMPHTPEVDEESGIYPGNGRYVRTMRAGIPGFGGYGFSEEIYLGVDASTMGARQARKNKNNFYICVHEGRRAVASKGTLVHSLVHEGLHATIGGAHNVNGNASKPEELDGFGAGNEACRALGLPPETDTPNYGAANPNYQNYNQGK